MSFSPTDEQISIVDAAKTHEDVVVEAYAGSGKTATLLLITESQPRRKFVYAPFNRSIADEAKRKFPRNTRCNTMHSLAFAAVGKNFMHRLNGPRVTAKQTASILNITQAFELREKVFLAPWSIARHVMDTVRNFCYSHDNEPYPNHVPFIPGAEDRWDEFAWMITEYARKAWADLQSHNGRLRFSHDNYLKMWALSEPYIPGDCFMLDESQDSNDLTMSIINAQEHMQKILIGDTYQQIYSWRGAKNVMEGFDTNHRLYLSKSFRFGEAIADEANKWLELLDAPKPLTGNENIPSRILDLDESDAILCRTNAEVVAQALGYTEKGKRVAVVGGMEEVKRFAEAALDLQSGKRTTHPELIAFENWTEVKQYVAEEGSDLRVMVSFIDTYGVPKVLEIAQTTVDEQFADIIISTAHKAKGREWKSVRIGTDFKPPEDATDAGQLSKAEMRLAYVATTRAQNELDRGSLEWVDHYVMDNGPLTNHPGLNENEPLSHHPEVA